MTSGEHRFIPVHDWVEKTVTDADRVIVVSNKFREEVIREIKGITKKTIVIPNGVNLELFKPNRKSPPTALYVGRFSKEKGIQFIPEIAEKVLKKDSRYKFVVVATKTNDEELLDVQNKFIELKEKYKKRFIWYDEPLKETEIAKLYQEAGVYVQPSIYETFGMCILEAMAAGTAVVGTKVGGIPEVIGNAGLLAKPDAKDISRKVLKLLGDTKLRKKYGALAIKRAQDFDWKDVAKQTLDLYSEVIEENKLKKQEIKNGK